MTTDGPDHLRRDDARHRCLAAPDQEPERKRKVTVKRSVTHEIVNPKLEDLRVLVNATSDAPGDTRIDVRAATHFNHPTDHGDPARISLTYEVTA